MPARAYKRTPTCAERARSVMQADPEKLEDAISMQIFEAVRDVLDRIGTSAICADCGRAIYWVQLVNGRRRVPFSSRGVPHTEDCDMIGRPGKLGRWNP